MAQHGEFFPENPQNTEELIDLLAQRAAAAQRMLNSMTRRAAGRADGAVPAGVRRPAAGRRRWPSSTPSCRACGPARTGTGRGRFRGDNPLGMGEATRAMEELGQLDALAEQLAQSYPGARLEDIDLDALGAAARRPGPGRRPRAGRAGARAAAARACSSARPDGSLRLSPKALRRLGESALRDVVDRIGSPPRRAGHPPLRGGRRGRPARPGRGRSATPRPGTCRARCSTPQLRRAGGDDRRLDVTDVEIVETEQRTRAAVALCVDTSWSMVPTDAGCR